MSEILTLPSPIHRLDKLSDIWNIDLWIKRDDLIPQFLGGNKVRKAVGILKSFDALPDVLITNGGSESNHARVVALLAAQSGRKAHLVLHGEKGAQRGNGYICAEAGAVLHYVRPEEIASKIQHLQDEEKTNGQSVGVIPGGGHSVEGAKAYSDAVSELPFEPDYIVHASGTGGTQAGLVLGAAGRGMSTKVIGVSVARLADRGRCEVEKLLPDSLHPNVLFEDRFRFGGYEKIGPELLEFVTYILKIEGLPLDPTYTGKAMYGLARMVATGEIEKTSRVVFWHTGGLLNLIAMGLSEK